jgi:hypothetical protein
MLDGIDDLGDAVSLRIRTADGNLHETVLSIAELGDGVIEVAEEAGRLVDGGEPFDRLESRRIELAHAHDPNFAVSLSGVRGLPHQIVAVYRQMLPHPRLRFVLADDPGAGKTIVAGLLLKELRLRMVADRRVREHVDDLWADLDQALAQAAGVEPGGRRDPITPTAHDE